MKSPAASEGGSRSVVFTFRLIHASHQPQNAPNAKSKTSLPPTYEWAARTSGLRMVAAILSTQHHAPEAQEGSTPRP
eukprot:1411444-Prymnesium_polylepis.1